MQVYAAVLKALAILLVLSGCTTTANRAKKANLSIADPMNFHALAFQADPNFGNTLNPDEKAKLSAAEQKALEFGADGQAISWTGNSTEVSGTVTTSRPFRVGSSNCRHFEHKISVKSVESDLAGTACRKGERTWRLIQ